MHYPFMHNQYGESGSTETKLAMQVQGALQLRGLLPAAELSELRKLAALSNIIYILWGGESGQPVEHLDSIENLIRRTHR
jgi:hypothetical protein